MDIITATTTESGMSAEPQEEATARARELQSGLYGEPLGDLFRRLMADLGLNQARLATVLGLSAPMLSQLMSGQRTKIGNPAVVQRIQALQDLANQVAEAEVTAAEATGRMHEIRHSAGSSLLGTTATLAGPGGAPVPTPRRMVREIQALLRTLASADELLTASATLAGTHPELAEFLRVYGAGRTDEAVAHYEAHQE